MMTGIDRAGTWKVSNKNERIFGKRGQDPGMKSHSLPVHF